MRCDAVREAYAAVSEEYISLFGAIRHVPVDDLELIGRHLGSVAGPVLDLGCGPGHLTGYLHSLGVDVTGIDLVPEFIDHARTAHPRVRFRAGSLTALDQPEHSVAGLLAWYSLIHLTPAQLDEAFTGFRRVLAPGGVVVLGLVDGDEVSVFDHKVITAYRWTAGEISRRLARVGIVELERQRRDAEGGQRPHLALAGALRVAPGG